MAIGNPALVGSNTATTSGTSLATASTCVIPAGSLVVVVVFNRATADPGDPTSVTDGTNNYTKDIASGVNGDNGRVSVWSFYDTAGRTATITANFGTSSTRGIYVYTIASAASSSARDQTGSGVAFSRSLVVTTAGNIAQADEDSIVAYFVGGTAVVSGFPFTNYTQLVKSTVNSRQFLIEYRNQLTAGATESAGGATDVASNTNLGRVIVTYKGAAGGATDQIVPAGINATSAVTASILDVRLIAPSVTASSAMSATVNRQATVKPASVNATSVLTASVGRVRPLAPSAITATSAVTGSVVRTRPVTTTITASSTVTVTLHALRGLAASITSSSTVTLSRLNATRVFGASIAATSSAVVVFGTPPSTSAGGGDDALWYRGYYRPHPAPTSSPLRHVEPRPFQPAKPMTVYRQIRVATIHATSTLTCNITVVPDEAEELLRLGIL